MMINDMMVSKYHISPLSEEIAHKIMDWRYQPPYDLYDLSENDLPGLLKPEYRYHQVFDGNMELVGYCCYGLDARVPGGNYDIGEPAVLDVGLGMHPNLVGQGRGAGFLGAILDFGKDILSPERFRATIASFNQRSLRTFQGQGFQITGRFRREFVALEFYQVEKQIKEEQDG